MKLVFSTKNVNRSSFLELCRYAYDYGFSGFEIYDALRERKQHADSILRSDRASDARRKLLNRQLAVSALRCPVPLDSEEATADTLITEAHPEGVRVGIDAEYAGSFADFGLATQSKRLCAAEVVAACGDQTVQLMLQSVNGRRQRVPLQGDGNEISVMRRRTGMGRVRFVRIGVQADHDGPMRLYAIRLNARGGA